MSNINSVLELIKGKYLSSKRIKHRKQFPWHWSPKWYILKFFRSTTVFKVKSLPDSRKNLLNKAQINGLTWAPSPLILKFIFESISWGNWAVYKLRNNADIRPYSWVRVAPRNLIIDIKIDGGWNNKKIHGQFINKISGGGKEENV